MVTILMSGDVSNTQQTSLQKNGVQWPALGLWKTVHQCLEQCSAATNRGLEQSSVFNMFRSVYICSSVYKCVYLFTYLYLFTYVYI